jgi:hypothetical protein
MSVRPTPPVCGSCIHLRGLIPTEPSAREGNGYVTDDYVVPYCDAFPSGIPREILDGENTHHKPYPGDRGIQYEPLKG